MQVMTSTALDAWTGFVPLTMYILTTLLIYAVVGMMVFPSQEMDTDNEFLDNHYNFRNLKNGIITLLVMGTGAVCTHPCPLIGVFTLIECNVRICFKGNAWSEVIYELNRNNSSSDSSVTYIFFISYYIMIMTVFRLFSLMNIQKVRLQDYKTSILAQDQIKDFQVAWRTIHDLRPLTKTMSGDDIDIKELFHLLSILSRPLGLYVEGRTSILFKDLDGLARSVLLSVPKSISTPDTYTETRSNMAFVGALMPKKVRRCISNHF